MSTATGKKRLTVTLASEELAALAAIARHLGTTSASAAVRVALREHAEQIDKGRDRASRLPRAAA